MLPATRISRWVVERAAGPSAGAVVSVHPRVVNLRLDDGALLVLADGRLPPSPNAVSVAIGDEIGFTGLGIRDRDAVALAPATLRVGGVVVTLDAAAPWEPRPPVRPTTPPPVSERVREARALATAEGDRRSLLPLLWATDAWLRESGPIRWAASPARRLRVAATAGDGRAVRDAARGLAGLGPGLTPSGDDYLAGFTTAWTLGSEALGVARHHRDLVAAGVLEGARPGASPLGFAWIRHATRGETAEPMSHWFRAVLDGPLAVVGPATRTVLGLGSTSGADWITGALGGLDAALAAAGQGGTWS
jgi:hypothetical protein